MNLILQRFIERLEKNHMKYFMVRPDSNLVFDRYSKKDNNGFDFCWDVSGYEGEDTVHLRLRSRIPPELAVEMIKMCENYFANKEDWHE